MTPPLHIIIDGSNWIHRLYHAMNQPSMIPDQFRKWLRIMMEKWSPQSIRIALDSSGDNWRADLCPEYKAQRDKKPADLQKLLAEAEKWLRSWDVLRVPGHEADDLLCTWAHSIASTEQGRVLIASADRDLFQCIRDERVSVLRGFRTEKGEVTSIECFSYASFINRYTFYPIQWPQFRALVGDTSDNLGGVDGIGPHTATALLQKYMTIEDFLKADREFKTNPLTAGQTKRIRKAWESGDIPKWIRVHTLAKNAPVQGSAISS